MAAKTLNTRIKVRYDTLENWTTNNPDLLKGEIAVVEIPAQSNAGVVITEPAYLIKVGTGEPGTTTSYGGLDNQPPINKASFKALQYVTAQAGDVYSWAKAAQKPTYDATEITIPAGTENLNLSAPSTVEAILASIKSGLVIDTDTQYELELGTDTNAGKIRLNHKSKDDANFTPGDWVTVGVTVAAGNGIEVNTTNGTSTVSAKVSNATDNAITVDANGLYAPKASVTIYTPTAQTNDGTVDVLTSIATEDGHTFTQATTNLYTKDQIDALINPGMEFKGVITPESVNITENDIAALANIKKGDSYKISTEGTINAVAVKAGDLIIAVKDNPTTTIDNVNWALIPAGDDVEDTWREIQVNGTQLLGAGTSSGALNIKNGTGVTFNTANGLEIQVDTTAIATKEYVDGEIGTVQDQIDTLNSEHIDETTGKYDTAGSVRKIAQDAADAAVTNLNATLVAGTDPAAPGQDEYGKKKVFTTIAEVNGKLDTTNSVATVLGIEDIDMGDYLILNGGDAFSFAV